MAGKPELPIQSVLAWWDAVIVKRKVPIKLREQVARAAVFPFCNLFWKFIFEKPIRVLVKKETNWRGEGETSYMWQDTSEASFKGGLHAPFVLAGLGDDDDNVAKLWLSFARREQYASTACVSPWAWAEVQPGSRCFNTWSGIRLSHERARRDGSPLHQDWLDFKRYLRDGFLSAEPDEAVKTYFMKWYISCYVYPGRKKKVGCCLYSKAKQLGKTRLFEIMRYHLLGEMLCGEEKAIDVLEKYNEPLRGKLLFCLDEFGRNIDHLTELKRLLTSPALSIVAKGSNPVAEPNCIDFWLPSNDADAFDTEALACRIFVVLIEYGIKHPDFAQWKNRDWNYVHIAAGMLAEAEALDLAHWDPTVIPHSRGSAVQSAGTEELHKPVHAWLRAALEDEAGTEVTGVVWADWNPSSQLYNSFRLFHKGSAEVAKAWSMRKFSNVLVGLVGAMPTATMRPSQFSVAVKEAWDARPGVSTGSVQFASAESANDGQACRMLPARAAAKERFLASLR